jgi:hypothetical protein
MSPNFMASSVEVAPSYRIRPPFRGARGRCDDGFVAVRLVALALALGYFVAAGAICPVGQADRHRTGNAAVHAAHASHADCHGKGADRLRLLPRCPCGCGDGVAPGTGPIRLAAAPPPEATDVARAGASGQARTQPVTPPLAPTLGIDHVPLAA